MKKTFTLISHVIEYFLGVCAATVILTACGQSPKSEQYFEAHPAEIPAVLENCKQHEGATNCDTAGAAQAIINQKKWMSTPATRGVW